MRKRSRVNQEQNVRFVATAFHRQVYRGLLELKSQPTNWKFRADIFDTALRGTGGNIDIS